MIHFHGEDFFCIYFISGIVVVVVVVVAVAVVVVGAGRGGIAGGRRSTRK